MLAALSFLGINMFKPAALFLGFRYSRARHGNKFTRFINRFALAGIVIGVAALIVVSSVMNGFEDQLKQRILGVVPQLVVTPADGSSLANWQQLVQTSPKLQQQLALVPQVGSVGVVQSEGKRSEEHTSELQSRPHLVCRL